MRTTQKIITGTPQEIRAKIRLEYLRGEIEAERISYSEIAELQSLAEYIDKSDVLLLEWASVPEQETEHEKNRPLYFCKKCGQEAETIDDIDGYCDSCAKK